MADIFNMADTWNAGGTTFAAIKMNVTDTASAAASLLLDLQVGAASKFSVGKAGDVTLASAAVLSWSTDLKLVRDAANALAQRNGTTGQGFYIYNTYTDGSNYERAVIGWGGNDLYLQTERAGTGSARAMFVGTTGAANLTFRTNNTARWAVSSNGFFIPQANNSYDLGSSSLRVKDGYFGGTLSFGAHSAIAAETVTGYITITDAAGNSRKLAVVS